MGTNDSANHLWEKGQESGLAKGKRKEHLREGRGGGFEVTMFRNTKGQEDFLNIAVSQESGSQVKFNIVINVPHKNKPAKNNFFLLQKWLLE